MNGEPVTISYRASERQRDSESTSSYVLAHDYDGLGRLARKTHQGLGTNGYSLLLDFAYDDLGRTTRIVYPDDGTVVAYEYEGAYLKRVCEVDDPAKDCADPSALAYVSTVSYDSLGRRTKVSMPPGDRTYEYSTATQRLSEDRFDASGASGYWIQRDYGLTHTAYDEIGNLVDVRGGSSKPGDPVVAATYAYDERNRIASWTRSGVTEHYGYDTLGNLTGYATASAGVTNQSFGEARGARPHAVTSSSAGGPTVTYTYDADGNRASAIGGATDRYFGFDWANRLVSVGPTPGSISELGVVYDAQGMRLSDLRSGSGQRIYLDEHFTLARTDPWSATFDSAQFHIHAFGETIGLKFQDTITLRTADSGWGWPLPGPGPWAPWSLGLLLGLSAAGLLWLAVRLELHLPLAHRPAAAGAAWTLVLLVALPPLPAGSGGGGGVTARRWLLTDHLGSGVVWLDEQGVRQRHTEYAPFGKVDAQAQASGIPTPQIYAGHRRETETGLDYMQARWYTASAGAFVSVDPLVPSLGDPQSYNGYAYARNNPVSHTDPDGRCVTVWTCTGIYESKGTGGYFHGSFRGGSLDGEYLEGSTALLPDAINYAMDKGYAIRFGSSTGASSGSIAAGAVADVGGIAGGVGISQRETQIAQVPQTKAQERIDELEAKRVPIVDELERLRADLDCLGRTLQACQENEMGDNRGVRLLRALYDEGLPKGAERPGQMHKPGDVALALALRSKIQSQISLLETRLRAIDKAILKARRNEGRRVHPRRGTRRRRHRSTILLCFGLLVLSLSCSGGVQRPTAVTLEFRPAHYDRAACMDCRTLHFENSLGQMESLFVAETPSIQVSPGEISRTETWREPGGSRVLAIAIEPGAWKRILRLTEDTEDEFAIAVLARDFVLGTYSAATLRVSHGLVTFHFSGEARFEIALNALAVRAVDVGSISSDDLKDECVRAAAGNAAAEERCMRIISSDFDAQFD